MAAAGGAPVKEAKVKVKPTTIMASSKWLVRRVASASASASKSASASTSASSGKQRSGVRTAFQGAWVPEDSKMLERFLEMQGIWDAVQKAIATTMYGRPWLEFCGDNLALVREGGVRVNMTLDGVRRPYVALPSSFGMGTSHYCGYALNEKHVHLHVDLADKEVSVDHDFLLQDDGRLLWQMRRGDKAMSSYFTWSSRRVAPPSPDQRDIVVDTKTLAVGRPHSLDHSKITAGKLQSLGSPPTSASHPLQLVPETKVLASAAAGSSTSLDSNPASRALAVHPHPHPNHLARRQFGSSTSNCSSSSSSSRGSSVSGKSSRTTSSNGCRPSKTSFRDVRQRIQQSLLSCLQNL